MKALAFAAGVLTGAAAVLGLSWFGLHYTSNHYKGHHTWSR